MASLETDLLVLRMIGPWEGDVQSTVKEHQYSSEEKQSAYSI